MLKEIIFEKLFSKKDKRDDPLKDVNGKGTLQRYEEMLAEDWDNELVVYIENFTTNIQDPLTVLDRLIPYAEIQKGLNLYLGTGALRRRNVLQLLPKLYQIKGTKRAYEILFAIMDVSVVITEHFDYFGFDSATTLDSAVRRFDSGVCLPCTDYSLALTGTGALTTDQIKMLNSIIAFNEPINAKIRTLTYNGNPVAGLAPDYNIDYNIDFYI